MAKIMARCLKALIVIRSAILVVLNHFQPLPLPGFGQDVPKQIGWLAIVMLYSHDAFLWDSIE